MSLTIPPPSKNLGPLFAMVTPLPLGEGEGRGDVGGSGEATCEEDQTSTRYLKVPVTTPGPGLLHPFPPQSRCPPSQPPTKCQRLLAQGWHLGSLGHGGGRGEER